VSEVDIQDKTKHEASIEEQNRAAEELLAELESPFGAERLGEEAFKTAQEAAAKRGIKL
jgi:hypothetical protein